MKVGRNDSCPCGSGRKYKHCCLAAETAMAHPPEELAWRRIRAEMEGLPARMLRFVVDTYGKDAVDEAWQEFGLWDEDEVEFASDTPHLAVFMPWLFHAWSPDPGATEVADTALHEVPPTRAYLERKGARLAPVLRDYLSDCLQRTFSFYEVERCEPGHGFSLRDVLTGETREVVERSASQWLKQGDLTYALLASAQGATLAEAMSPVVLPPGDKLEVIELRKRMQMADSGIDRESLKDWDFELRELYLRLSERRLYPSLPKLQTTDGEDLEFHTLAFDVDSAQDAFDALRDLDILATEAQLLEQSERDADGSLRRVEITWARPGNQVHRQWDNTILGRIRIDGRSLTAEVNSRERADAFRSIVAVTLGPRARFRLDQVQSAERMLAQADSPRAAMESKNHASEDDPELHSLMTEYLERHYEAWQDTPIPALGDRTPREAVKDPDGCEQVEALVRQMERDGESQRPPVSGAVFSKLRQRLGLPT